MELFLSQPILSVGNTLMKILHFGCLIGLAFLARADALSQTRDIRPEDPAEAAKSIQVKSLMEQARSLMSRGSMSEALPQLQQAAAIQATMVGFKATANLELARAFVKLGRNTDALEAYRKVFCWNASKADLDVGSGPTIHPVMEYAILLAKEGRAEDAKAMYYFGLRHLNDSDRTKEPVPFLVVFDPEPEGIQWEYTPQRLEAAALMTQAMHDGWMDFATREQTLPMQIVARVRELAPDWFYPVMFKAAKNWNSERGPQLVSEADALARPGLERQLVTRYREDLAQHLANNEAADTPLATDMRPMVEGSLRRARMQCLRPNEQVLRRLSIERPGR